MRKIECRKMHCPVCGCVCVCAFVWVRIVNCGIQKYAVGQIARFNFFNIYELLINMQFTCAVSVSFFLASSLFSVCAFFWIFTGKYKCVLNPKSQAILFHDHISFVPAIFRVRSRFPFVCDMFVQSGIWFDHHFCQVAHAPMRMVFAMEYD